MVSPFDNPLNYIRCLNVILLRLNGPRNVQKCINKFGRAIELLKKTYVGSSICTHRRTRVKTGSCVNVLIPVVYHSPQNTSKSQH